MDEHETALKYYFLEEYLFETVGPKFRATGSLNEFDFFSILIWKANRAKSYAAERLKKRQPSLEDAVRSLALLLHRASGRRERFQVLVDGYGFRLPTASAILSVLWPDDFSVYDVRVCDTLCDFTKIGDISNTSAMWLRYDEYIEGVKSSVPGTLSLRDKDRVLWARSAMRQLYRDLEVGFGHKLPGAEAE
jgi:hypothetical protein